MNKIKRFDMEQTIFSGVEFENGLKPRGFVGKSSFFFGSTYDIGQRVQLLEYKEKYYVRAIIFTNSKVRYSLAVELKPDSFTTFHNIDSAMVIKGYDERIEFEEDNYS